MKNRVEELARALVAMPFGSAHLMVECSGKSIAEFAPPPVAPASMLCVRAYLRGIPDLAALFQTCTATSFGWQSPSIEHRVRFVDPQWILDHDLVLDAWRSCKRQGRAHRLPQYRPPLGANH